MRKIKFIPGNIYHIFNRGVEKRNIFIADADRWRFLQGMYLFNDKNVSTNLLFRLEKENQALNFNILRDFINRNPQERKPLVRILADCLMPNHYHLLLEEIQENGISRFMHKLGVGYTKYFNKKYERVGSLFQGTFKAVPIENDLHLQYILIYINVVNPAQLIEPEFKESGAKDIEKVMRFVENFPWSTHREYGGIRNSFIVEKGIFNNLFPNPSKYIEFSRDLLTTKKFSQIDSLLLE